MNPGTVQGFCLSKIYLRTHKLLKKILVNYKMTALNKKVSSNIPYFLEMGSLMTSSSSAGPIQISKFPEPCWYIICNIISVKSYLQRERERERERKKEGETNKNNFMSVLMLLHNLFALNIMTP